MVDVIGDVTGAQVCLIMADIVHLAVPGVRGINDRHRVLCGCYEWEKS